MIKNLFLLGSALMTSSVVAVQKFTIPLPKPITIDQVDTFKAGFHSSLDLTVLKQAGNQWFDTIIQVVNGITIPNFYGDGKDYMQDNHFYIEQRLDNVVLAADIAKNAITLNCNKLTAKFRSNDFRYKIAPLMVANGWVEVDMNTVDIGFGLQFKTQISPTTGRQLMMVETVDVIVDINRNDIKLHIGGGFWSDLASLFTIFFKGTVVDMIRDSVTIALDTAIPQIANAFFVHNDGYIHMPFVNRMTLDWESPNAVIVTSDSWNLASKGLFFDDTIGEIAPNVTIPAMPYKDISNAAGFQNFISTWSIDAFFQAGLSISPIGGWKNATETNGTWSLTTSTVGGILPGIADAYGADQPVDIKYRLLAVTDVRITENDQNMGGLFTLGLDFWVNQTDNTMVEAASITLQDTDFAFTALINNMTLGMQINTINVDKVLVNSCAYGNLNAKILNVKLNSAFLVARPVINAMLSSKNIRMPTHLGKYFILSDLVLGYYNDFLFVGWTPTFVGPSALAEQQFIKEARKALPKVAKGVKVSFT